MGRKVVKKKVTVSDPYSEKRLSNLMEDAMAEVSEKIFTRLHDDGYIAHCVYMDTNMGTDLLGAIESELRKCIRGSDSGS